MSLFEALWPGVFLVLLALFAEIATTKTWAFVHLNSLVPSLFLLGSLAFVAGFLAYRFRGSRAAPKARFSPKIAGETALLALLCGLFYAIFTSFRMRYFAPPPEGLGDSLLLVQHVPVHSLLLGYLVSFDEILELYFHSKLYLAMHRQGYGVEDVYALLSTLFGTAYVVVVWFFLRRRRIFEILAGFCLFLAMPALQLFAGYVENYALTLFYFSALLFASASFLERKRPANGLVWLALLSAWGALHHMLVAPMAASLGLLVFFTAGKDWKRMIRLSVAPVCAAMFLLSLVIGYFLFFAPVPLAITESFSFRPPLLPVRRLFSTAHFLDMLNLLVLVSPASCLLFPVLFALFLRQKQSLKRFFLPGDVEKFLFSACILYLLFAFVTNPLIGFPADWDLLGFFQAPLHLYLFHLLRRHLPRNFNAYGQSFLLASLFLVSLVSTGAWLSRNSASSGGHLGEAKLAVRNFLSHVREAAVFERLPSIDRKKKYIEISLFLIRSEKKLKRLEEEGLLAELRTLSHEFETWILLPEEAYQEQHDSVWGKLSRFNVKVSDL